MQNKFAEDDTFFLLMHWLVPKKMQRQEKSVRLPYMRVIKGFWPAGLYLLIKNMEISRKTGFGKAIAELGISLGKILNNKKRKRLRGFFGGGRQKKYGACCLTGGQKELLC